MIRAALATLLFGSALWASGQIAPAAPALQAPPSPAVAQTSLDGTSDGDGEWTPQPEAMASITESAWKTRTLHAGLSAAAHPRAVVTGAPADRPVARASAAPSYLLHTPLLI